MCGLIPEKLILCQFSPLFARFGLAIYEKLIVVSRDALCRTHRTVSIPEKLILGIIAAVAPAKLDTTQFANPNSARYSPAWPTR